MAKILIIEDNEFMARMFLNIFSIEKYDVQVAHNGEDGLEKAKTFQPDLILLDVIMPQMSGVQVLEKLKADPATKNISVAMLTVIAEDEVIKKCHELGAIGYLIKPNLNPDQILAEVRTYLQRTNPSAPAKPS